MVGAPRVSIVKLNRYRHGIRRMFYTRKLPNTFNFTQKKRANRDIFGEKMRMWDVLLIYFEQFVSLFANFYSNTKSDIL